MFGGGKIENEVEEGHRKREREKKKMKSPSSPSSVSGVGAGRRVYGRQRGWNWQHNAFVLPIQRGGSGGGSGVSSGASSSFLALSIVLTMLSLTMLSVTVFTLRQRDGGMEARSTSSATLQDSKAVSSLVPAIFNAQRAEGERATEALVESQDDEYRVLHQGYKGLTHLVVVACHSVYTGSDFTKADDDDNWALEPFQKTKPPPIEVNGAEEGGGAEDDAASSSNGVGAAESASAVSASSSFIEHIQKGIQVTARDPQALLLFSGGQTRLHGSPLSEAQGYWMVASAARFHGHADIKWRVLTEEFARDSYENLLFSLCRFQEVTGHYPSRVTIVGYDMKRARFINHRASIKFPLESFDYIGTEIVGRTEEDREGARTGEAKTRALFARDPYGCLPPLSTKRLKRDPFRRGLPYSSRSCPEMQRLLAFCSPHNEDAYPGSTASSTSTSSIANDFTPSPTSLYSGTDLPWR